MEGMRFARRALALLLAVALAGCTSIRQVGSRPFEGEGGALRVRVFADDDAKSAGAILAARIVGELERREGRAWRPVFRSIEPSWTVAGLLPGSYRVTFSAKLNAEGEVEGLERTVRLPVEVVGAQLAEVEVVLDHVSTGMIVAGVAAAVVAAVLLHDWLDDLDLPAPPPPPAWVADAVFWVTLDLLDEPEGWVERTPGPTVTSHFPRAGETVPAPRPRAVFVLSEPLDPASVRADTIEVTTADGGLVAGTTSWDAERWWLVWVPDVDLPRGARLHVGLDAEGLAAETGLPFSGPVGFDFETAP
jgi:hypothetical protein